MIQIKTRNYRRTKFRPDMNEQSVGASPDNASGAKNADTTNLLTFPKCRMRQHHYEDQP